MMIENIPDIDATYRSNSQKMKYKHHIIVQAYPDENPSMFTGLSEEEDAVLPVPIRNKMVMRLSYSYTGKDGLYIDLGPRLLHSLRCCASDQWHQLEGLRNCLQTGQGN